MRILSSIVLLNNVHFEADTANDDATAISTVIHVRGQNGTHR
jgi:hypothetical protein